MRIMEPLGSFLYHEIVLLVVAIVHKKLWPVAAKTLQLASTASKIFIAGPMGQKRLKITHIIPRVKGTFWKYLFIDL